MLYVILIIVAALVIGFVILVSLRPADFRISRSASINAPPATVFPIVNDFHNWNDWSPWAKIDPEMKTTFEGPPSGVGTKYEWSGNNKVGAGRMTITEVRPDTYIRIRLEFLRPFKVTNTAEFDFQPQGDQTIVTWSMSGKNNFVFKAFGLFMSMDKMVGKDFEKGLAQLKTIAESTNAK